MRQQPIAQIEGSAVAMKLDKQMKKLGVSKKARKSLLSGIKKDPDYKKAKAKLKKVETGIEKAEAEYESYIAKAKKAEKALRNTKKTSKKKASKKKSGKKSSKKK